MLVFAYMRERNFEFDDLTLVTLILAFKAYLALAALRL